MFDVAHSPQAPPLSPVAARLRAWANALGDLDRTLSDPDRIEAITALEELKSAAAAAQAQLTADFAASQRAEQIAHGVRPSEVGRGVAAQVALARRESPHAGARLMGVAQALTTEMPHSWAALRAGHLSEWRAGLLVRETACLTREHRALVDAEVAGDPVRLADLGNRSLVAATRTAAYRLDPRSIVHRARRARSERCVTLRPAPDTMSYLTALVPVGQGVAAYAALARAADAARAAGDPRGRGQLLADTLVETLTGQASAEAVPVAVHLVMSTATLLGGTEPATLQGTDDPVPAELARDLIAHAPREGRWLRRLFITPDHGQVAGTDSRARCFPSTLARLIALRDRTCRTPWCDAPIRHTDHVLAHTDDGPTTLSNGQGLCEACNHTKTAPGWHARPGPHGAGDEVFTTTPTGHRHHSRAPDLPGVRPSGYIEVRPPLRLIWALRPASGPPRAPAAGPERCLSDVIAAKVTA